MRQEIINKLNEIEKKEMVHQSIDSLLLGEDKKI